MSVEVLGILLASAGASYALRAWQRRREPRRLEDVLAEDAAVVVSVATHEAGTRQHPEIWPIHLLYGLLQDEVFVETIKRLGGDPDAIENRVLAELDRRPARERDDGARLEALRVLAFAHHGGERQMTCKDLWAYLARTTTAQLVDGGELTRHALLFTLVHGMPEPSTALPDRTDVHVVLRNDDYTTRELVTEILEDVFGMSEADAETRMLQVHNEGRGVVGRFKLDVARPKIDEVRRRARERMLPLWIGVEDC
ncbi:MAG TPA: ATP-dependent Clp protease adaptor ClpS [Kofleriaceae bacterium]|nr:ATP-dependent Clp protease adaptor ClpS [Kofleriaceae bacterium]